MSRYFQTECNVFWDPKLWRIRCQGHVINLIVQAFLFTQEDLATVESDEKETVEDDNSNEDENDDEDAIERLQQRTAKSAKEKERKYRAMGVLGKLHNVVVHTRSSPRRAKIYKELYFISLQLKFCLLKQ